MTSATKFPSGVSPSRSPVFGYRAGEWNTTPPVSAFTFSA
jgi:hypothetical protein